MLTYVRELWDTRELLANLTMRDVKGKYRRTILGQLWSLINPLATMLVYTIVFSFIFKAQPRPGDPSGLNVYPLWLICGLLPWTFFTRVVNGSMSAVIQGAGLIKKVYFPRMQLPLAAVGATGFTWLNEMGLVVVVVMLFGGWSLPWVPLLILAMVLFAMFAAGIGMMFAILNVHFRDTEHFVAIALRLLMYLTPVLYPLTIIQTLSKSQGAWILDLFEANPIEHFIEVFRNLLYDNRWPALSDWAWCAGCGIVFFVVGCVVFMRNERKLAVQL